MAQVDKIPVDPEGNQSVVTNAKFDNNNFIRIFLWEWNESCIGLKSR